MLSPPPLPLIDPFARAISYVRVSVTDRCDLRCTYCMDERQQFVSRSEQLSIDELERLCLRFMALGTRVIRLTGGEPLVRPGIIDLVERLGRHIGAGRLDELTLTTNGTQAAGHAAALAAAGVRRVNVSVDSCDADRFRAVTRGGDLNRVIDGIEALSDHGIACKINSVAMADVHGDDHLFEHITWAHGLGLPISLIETMPMGEVGTDRRDQFLSLATVRQRLEAHWTLTPLTLRTPGPARYVRVEETGGIIGFITPLSDHFCDSCNRVRLTATGKLYMCLGQEDNADLKAVMRAHPDDDAAVEAAIRSAIARKPKGHDFAAAMAGGHAAVSRPMSLTGG
jgi:cyclic pyranopterin phosphate synthase